jgi:hypothetical protein
MAVAYGANAEEAAGVCRGPSGTRQCDRDPHIRKRAELLAHVQMTTCQYTLPPLGTRRQMVLDRVGGCLTEFIDGLPLEHHHISDVDDLSRNRFACSSKAMRARCPVYAIGRP